MGFLVIGLMVVGTVGALGFRRSWQREHIQRLRDQARLKAIESQMAGLRAALRISAAEQATRRRMHTAYNSNVFANSTAHEEPETWR
jgi:hypothetical protein